MPRSVLSDAIAVFIENRGLARLEKFDKEAHKLRAEGNGRSVEIEESDAKIAQQRIEEIDRYKPRNWLEDAANRAKQISIVTHALKFSHSDAKGSSIYLREDATESTLTYLTTASLKEIRLDVVGNAAALDVAGLLQLEAEGKTLLDFIANGDGSALAPFAESREQLTNWLIGFKAAIADKELSSHKLAKQLYFPVADDSYHLLSPIFATSLSQALHDRINKSRFSEEARALRKAKKEEKFAAGMTVQYRNIAVQNFGGTKPQNVSLLNSGRGGKTYLLSNSPPVWTQRQLPPSKHKAAFWFEYDRRAWRTAKELKDFLMRVAKQDNNIDIRETRADLVDELIAILLQYAAEVQNLSQYAGWSEDSALPLAEQLWLDPLREDKTFQAQREAGDWRLDIANSFAFWLNKKLTDDLIVFKDVEYREWLLECLEELKI